MNKEECDHCDARHDEAWLSQPNDYCYDCGEKL
jgi:hypothetical protein